MTLNKNQWSTLKAKILSNLHTFKKADRLNMHKGTVPGIGVVVVDHYYRYILRIEGEDICVPAADWDSQLREVWLAIVDGDPNAAENRRKENDRKRADREAAKENRRNNILEALGD